MKKFFFLTAAIVTGFLAVAQHQEYIDILERFGFRMPGVRTGEEIALDVEFRFDAIPHLVVPADRVGPLGLAQLKALAVFFEGFLDCHHR